MTKAPRKSAGGGDGRLALRVALAGAWHVVRGRSLRQLGRVLALLEAVGRAAPGLLRFRHAARLRLGLRAAVLMRMLREPEPDGRILDALDCFFPEGEGPEAPPPGPAHPTPRELRLVGEAQESFRELILGLLGDPVRRAEYLKFAAGLEYGDRFLGSLESLFHEFLCRVEAALPPPEPKLLQELVLSHAPPRPRPLELPILSRYLSDVGHAPRVPPLAPSPPRPHPPRRLRPLQPPPLEFIGDPKLTPPKKARPRRSPPPPDPDGQGDRDRHRTHRQGGADQGEGGGERGDPPPAAEADLQREADERRENRGRLQDPGGVGAAPGAGAQGRGFRGRGLGGRGHPGAGPPGGLRRRAV